MFVMGLGTETEQGNDTIDTDTIGSNLIVIMNSSGLLQTTSIIT